MAIIGASERAGAIGTVLVTNMRAAQYRGALFAVNPKHRSVQGVPCFPSISKVPQRVDLVIIAPPLNACLVAELIRGTRVSKLLGPFRKMPPVDFAALESALLRVSEMVCELPWITELDITQ